MFSKVLLVIKELSFEATWLNSVREYVLSEFIFIEDEMFCIFVYILSLNTNRYQR